MCEKNKNYLILGLAPNFVELINDQYIESYLPLLSETHTIIGLNEIIKLDTIRPFCDYFITIDFYTWEYLKMYPDLQNKMWIDKSVKKYCDRNNVLQEISNIFSVDDNIHEKYEGKLYLNRRNPTVLHTALNFCLIKSIEYGCRDNTVVKLWGHELDKEWKHFHREETREAKTYNTDEMILNKRKSVYKFGEYYKLYTCNKQCTLTLPYTELLS